MVRRWRVKLLGHCISMHTMAKSPLSRKGWIMAMNDIVSAPERNTPNHVLAQVHRPSIGGLIAGLALCRSALLAAPLPGAVVSFRKTVAAPAGATGTGDVSIFRDSEAHYGTFFRDFVGSYAGGAGNSQTRRTLLR